MPTEPKCREEIRKRQPPVYCDEISAGYCQKVQVKIDQYCKHTGFPADLPVPQIVQDGQMCWCCCDCLAFHTPVEVAPGAFRFIQEIEPGETVLTTGLHAGTWTPRRVVSCGGIDPGVELEGIYALTFRCGAEVRHLVATADHLFLNPDGKLVPVRELGPGALLRSAAGGYAEVLHAVVGTYSGGIRHVELGDYIPGEPLDGHLLNANGLIAADLSVQLAYFAGQLNETVLA